MQIKVLDHGYVEFIEAWGRGRPAEEAPHWDPAVDYEVAIIEAARQSTQGSFRRWEGDSKLLTYLYRNKHLTPFENDDNKFFWMGDPDSQDGQDSKWMGPRYREIPSK